jgi:hypothetical protein
MKKVLTEEQKQQRAETARRNGAKSKGPVTIEGKHRSSMNAITVGKFVDVHDEELPAFATLLSTEDRKAYVRLHQANLRQCRPDSEVEHGIVRHITAEQFQLERYENLETLQLQIEHDNVLREFPDLPDAQHSHQAIQRAANNDKVFRFLERKKRAHLAAWNKFVQLLERMKKSFPMLPPEPVDITADSEVLIDPDPPQYVVEEMLKLADQAKKEPNFPLPRFVVHLLYDERLLEKCAPHYDVTELRKRYPKPKPDLAA